MSDAVVPLGGEDIKRYLHEVADELEGRGTQHVIVVVGGSLLAMHGLRGATRDVDSVTRLDAELVAAVAVVATRHDLAPRWLNDAAAAFMPGGFDETTCDVLVEHQRLLVLGAPLDQVFLMKLYASRELDRDDLVRLWPLCEFDSPAEAARRFEVAYPHVDPDEYLVEYITEISRAAAASG